MMVDNDKKWAMSCYIPIFNILTCVLCSIKKVNSKFCLFHARQGLALFALWLLTIIIALISQPISLMMWGVVLLLHGAGIVIVYNKAEVKIPVLGHLAMKIPPYYLFKLLTGKSPEEQISSTETSDSSSDDSKTSEQELKDKSEPDNNNSGK
jgi:uncharacterized membrane protein